MEHWQDPKRQFVIAGWNGMIKELKSTLADYPEAVHWTDNWDRGPMDANGWTALHGAAAQCHTEAIQLLLKAGADVNARDEKGRTPLMMGAQNGGKTHVQALLDGGADATLTDNAGLDAIAHTKESFPQPQNAAIISRHIAMLELKAAQEEEARRQADIEGTATQMRDGAAKPVTVGKPLKLKI